MEQPLYNTLQNHDLAGFWHQLGVFALLAACFIVAAVYRQYLQQRLLMRWRTRLTHDLLQRWLEPGTAYRLANEPVVAARPRRGGGTRVGRSTRTAVPGAGVRCGARELGRADLQRQGVVKLAAIQQAAAVRLRPILMTTAAMVLGVLPLVTASGAGAAGRHAMGLVIAAGLAIGTLFTLFMVPAVYLLVGADHAKAAAALRRSVSPERGDILDRNGDGIPP